MNFRITIRESDVRGMINRTFGPGVRRQILGAGGAELLRLSRENFGVSGPERPIEWAPLSKDYAKRVKRTYATLDLKGDLYRSGRLNVSDDRAVVSFEDRKASWHQFGEGKMPPRPFMPMYGNRLSPSAERRVTTAMALELQKILRGSNLIKY